CFFFQAEDGIRDFHVTGVQTCALPILKGYATITFLKDFSFTTNISYDRFSETRTRYGTSSTGPYVNTGGAFGKTYQNVGIFDARSEERRVGKECRDVWLSSQIKKTRVR